MRSRFLAWIGGEFQVAEILRLAQNDDRSLVKENSGFLRRRQCFRPCGFAAFFDDVEAIDGEIGEAVDLAGGPAHFDPIDDGSLVEAEVQAEIVLRVVAAAAAHFVDLRQGLFGILLRFSDNRYARADAGAI